MQSLRDFPPQKSDGISIGRDKSRPYGDANNPANLVNLNKIKVQTITSITQITLKSQVRQPPQALITNA
ncbi:MAG: hypothetical protein LBD59_09545 [Prevotellaceae bacterium]|jgi:hypothetical protein|nr:hypothetical protein [Prevotellaceae bacterium]